MPFLSKRKDDFEQVKVWEYSENWNNPFGNDDEGPEVIDVEEPEVIDVEADPYGVTTRGRSSGHDKTKTKKKKKRKRHRKKKEVTDEESSQADSLLSSILSESEREAIDDLDRMMTLDEDALEEAEQLDDEDESMMDQHDDDSMNVLASSRENVNYGVVRYNRVGGATVASDHEKEDDEEDGDSNEIVAYRNYSPSQKKHKQFSPRSSRRHHQVTDSSDDDEDDSAIRAPYSNYTLSRGTTDESSMQVQGYSRGDDSSIEDGNNPFDGMNALLKTNKNPFGDEDKDGEESDDSSLLPPASPSPYKNTGKANTSSNPFADDDEEAEDDEVASDVEGDMMYNESPVEECIETTLQESKGVVEIRPATKTKSHEDSDDEDIVESSKRLLRMADQRIQYQQHSDEVQDLKATIDRMNGQAEAMAEQLRRAVETKCDLVLAQNEMERCHEQDLIAKDDELKDMRMYIQELLDTQAKSELNFMNEISSLARKIEVQDAKHKEECEEKDARIAELERKIRLMKTGSVRGNSSREAFKSRFMDVENRSIGSNSSSKKKVFPL